MRANHTGLRIIKVGPDRWRLELRVGTEYVRRVRTKEEITEFLLNGKPVESNLGPGSESMTFAAFARDHYLRLDAPRRLKKSSLRREEESLTALNRYFKEVALDKITRQDWDKYQLGRLSGELSAPGRHCGPSGVLKEFKSMRSVLMYGVDAGHIRRNVLAGIKPRKLGLYDLRRADVWLKRDEICRVLDKVPSHLRAYFEFIVWTGARPDEACQFGRDNISTDGKEIWIITTKKRKTDGDANRKRRFRVASLGPHFQELLTSLVAHPETGLFFCNPATGRRYVARYLQLTFKKAVAEAGIERRVVPYDLRGTFAMHRAMVVNSFRQLQAEMGHGDPKSIQNYLDEAATCDPKESIFYGVDASWSGSR